MRPCPNAVSKVAKHLRALYLPFGGSSLNILGYEKEKNKTQWKLKISTLKNSKYSKHRKYSLHRTNSKNKTK